MIRRWFGVATLVCVALVSLDCSSVGVQSPITRERSFETVKRLVAGERPESPDAAEDWLGEAVQDARRWKKRADLVCVGAAQFNHGLYPAECLRLDKWYQSTAVPLRVELEGFIEEWRMAGGELDEAATEYFAGRIAERIPALETLLEVLESFSTSELDEATTLPVLASP